MSSSMIMPQMQIMADYGQKDICQIRVFMRGALGSTDSGLKLKQRAHSMSISHHYETNISIQQNELVMVGSIQKMLFHHAKDVIIIRSIWMMQFHHA